jgi:hypothetical protein
VKKSLIHSASVALAALAFGTALPAGAQEASGAAPATASPTGDCEIHVWPAERFSARTSGWGVGFGMIGALADSKGHAKGDQARKAAIAGALDSESQAETLGALDLSKSLGLKPSKIVLHNEPLDRKTINKISTRRSDSTSACYAELIVADLFYQKAAIYGRSLKTLFMLRKFGAAKDNPVIYKGWGGNGLKLFPPKPGDDVQAANEELIHVFKADFDEFARNATKAPTAS